MQFKVQSDELLSEAQFVQWMKMEPLCLVWLPTLHRTAAAETGMAEMLENTNIDTNNKIILTYHKEISRMYSTAT